VLRRLCLVALVLYGLVVAAVTLTPNLGGPAASSNWVPLASLRPTFANLWAVATHPEYLQYIDEGAVAQHAGNVLLFVPLGWLLPVVWSKFRSPMRVFALATLISLAIEICQLLIVRGRMSTIDDVLLNCLGALIGIKTFLIASDRLGKTSSV
jgi:glycopeptide antibiotics resistance protein